MTKLRKPRGIQDLVTKNEALALLHSLLGFFFCLLW